MMFRRFLTVAFTVTLFAAPAFADWYDDYDEGIKAAARENWRVVVEKMNAAIAKKPQEGRQKTYGTIFIDYRPYYYRGVAYFNLGDLEKALADLQKTKAAPPNAPLGSLEGLVAKVEARIAAGRQPPPTDTVARVDDTTTRTTTSVEVPTLDPTVRRRAESLLAEAEKKRDAARTEQAETYAAEQFRQGTQRLQTATNARSDAETTEDWRAVGQSADAAIRSFDAAISTARTRVAELRSDENRAVDDTMAQMRNRVRGALTAYFDGNFKSAETQLEQLTREDKDNAMLWAFLGAARYYSYYLDGAENEQSRVRAINAFREARRLKPNLVLDDDYFSARVRTFYRTITRSG